MNQQELQTFKYKFILTMSIFLLVISIVLETGGVLTLSNSLMTTSVDIKQMSTANVAMKSGVSTTYKKIIEVKNNETIKETGQIKNISNPVNERVWYLPTEYGTITSYPSYGHVAYDITSPRGTQEVIYPVARGIISSIYRDNAGALIVTVRHLINGKYYTSQYAHLSSYANIYVGEEVTPFTPLGWMGTTGRSTGVHLHIALLDCNMFGSTDMCSDLNGFFSYGKIRFSQGFTGLSNVINVPYQWYSR